MNTIFLFYITLTITVHCYLKKNIVLSTSTAEESAIQSLPPASLQQAEEIFLKSIYTNLNNKNSVCKLTKYLQIAICERIFQKFRNNNLKIYLNKIAFFINSPKCEKNPTVVRTRIFFLDEIIMQEMYPCYGRHNTVHTDYITDDYYSKIYVSQGIKDDSFIVYIHEYNAESEWYTVNSYLENLSELEPQTTITIKDIQHELTFNNELVRTYKQKQIEYIYLRENNSFNLKDPICDLPKDKKQALCQLLFNYYVYEMVLWIAVNKTVFFLFDPICLKYYVKIRYSEQHRKNMIKQQMLTCYARSRLSLGNVLYDKNSRNFNISTGPRKNSIIVYAKLFNGIKNEFYLFNLIENFEIKNLKPAMDNLQDLYEENKNYWFEITKLNAELLVMRSCLEEKESISNTIVEYHLGERYNQEKNKIGTMKKQFENYNIIKSKVAVLIKEEITSQNRSRKVTELDTLALPGSKIIQNIEHKFQEIKEIILKSYLDEKRTEFLKSNFEIKKKEWLRAMKEHTAGL